MRETARSKADRLLLEGRLIVLTARPGLVHARVRGEGVIHDCGYGAGMWRCSCPVRTDECSHLIALRRVIAVEDQTIPTKENHP